MKSFRELLRAHLKAAMSTISPEWLAKLRYFKQWRRWLSLSNPQLFDEKLLWLMLFWRHPLKQRCADKYAMRSYVEQHGLGHMLPSLLGVYENTAAIDFDALPQKFVLKCTHGCGCNIICQDKTLLDREKAIRRLDEWMRRDYSKSAGELHYAGIKPRIIAEAFLDDGTGGWPTDYKLYCFNGYVHCTLVCTERASGKHLVDFYDRDWQNRLPYRKSSVAVKRSIPRPPAYEEMIKAAETLCKPFPFVRLDCYSVNSKAYVGEMTFTPSACINHDYTDFAERELGQLIQLPRLHLYNSSSSDHRLPVEPLGRN